MTQLLCRNRISDFPSWKKVLASQEPALAAAGLRLRRLWRERGDPGDAFCLFDVSDLERARAFVSDPAARSAGQAAGIFDAEIHFVDPQEPALAAPGPAGSGPETRVRASFERQRFMAALGATLVRVAPGEVDIRLPFRDDLTQQHGFVHAGAITSVVDTACGYAALTRMPPGAAVLTVEFKVNLLAPGQGEAFLARGRVLKAGRTLVVCTGEVVALAGAEERAVASMMATMMAVRDRPGLAD